MLTGSRAIARSLTPVAALIASTWTVPAVAQVGNGCYLQTASGRVINLDRWCNGNDGSAGTRSTSTPAPPKSVYRAQIKYRLGKTPVIAVTFNGRQSFEMVLDTGADASVITRQMAESLALPIVGSGRFEMADGRVIQLPIAQVQSISVDGAEIRDVPVAISEKTSIGLLGHDFLEQFDIKIKQNVVEFYRRS